MPNQFASAPDVVILDADMQHVQRLAALDRECFTEDDVYDEREWHDYCSSAFFNKVVLWKEMPGDSQNSILANMVATEDDRYSVHVDSLAVSAPYRKQGFVANRPK